MQDINKSNSSNTSIISTIRCPMELHTHFLPAKSSAAAPASESIQQVHSMAKLLLGLPKKI